MRGRAHLHRGPLPLPLPRSAAATAFTLAEGRREASHDGRAQPHSRLHLAALKSKRVFAPARAKTKLQGAPPLLRQESVSRLSSQQAAGAPRGGATSARAPLCYGFRDQGGRPHSLTPPPQFGSFSYTLYDPTCCCNKETDSIAALNPALRKLCVTVVGVTNPTTEEIKDFVNRHQKYLPAM
ncbi:hypothetical protein NDU88_000875 [Pleurodeles waltl]|uniref:Uncharacterized protein n=1 Tax=Pleurodeles waltl TaxID=8319 RepID=A0AAV7S8G9_PLEWA|nr:hypothetical protein NDU88_000875 [Pleurodeles waltl]